MMIYNDYCDIIGTIRIFKVMIIFNTYDNMTGAYQFTLLLPE